MTRDPVVLRHDETIAVAINKMAVGGFRHIPIVEDGRPTGVVSARDVFRHLARVARLTPGEPDADRRGPRPRRRPHLVDPPRRARSRRPALEAVPARTPRRSTRRWPAADAVIVDLTSPGLRRPRRDRRSAATPVVRSSRSGQHDDHVLRRRALAVGADRGPRLSQAVRGRRRRRSPAGSRRHRARPADAPPIDRRRAQMTDDPARPRSPPSATRIAPPAAPRSMPGSTARCRADRRRAGSPTT